MDKNMSNTEARDPANDWRPTIVMSCAACFRQHFGEPVGRTFPGDLYPSIEMVTWALKLREFGYVFYEVDPIDTDDSGLRFYCPHSEIGSTCSCCGEPVGDDAVLTVCPDCCPILWDGIQRGLVPTVIEPDGRITVERRVLLTYMCDKHVGDAAQRKLVSL